MNEQEIETLLHDIKYQSFYVFNDHIKDHIKRNPRLYYSMYIIVEDLLDHVFIKKNKSKCFSPKFEKKFNEFVNDERLLMVYEVPTRQENGFFFHEIKDEDRNESFDYFYHAESYDIIGCFNEDYQSKENFIEDIIGAINHTKLSTESLLMEISYIFPQLQFQAFGSNYKYKLSLLISDLNKPIKIKSNEENNFIIGQTYRSRDYYQRIEILTIREDGKIRLRLNDYIKIFNTEKLQVYIEKYKMTL